MLVETLTVEQFLNVGFGTQQAGRGGPRPEIQRIGRYKPI